MSSVAGRCFDNREMDSPDLFRIHTTMPFTVWAMGLTALLPGPRPDGAASVGRSGVEAKTSPNGYMVNMASKTFAKST